MICRHYPPTLSQHNSKPDNVQHSTNTQALERGEEKLDRLESRVELLALPTINETDYHFQIMMRNYSPISIGLISQNDVIIKFTAEKLKKIIGLAITEWVPQEPSKFYVKFSYGSEKFLAKKEKELLKLHHIGHEIGRGTFGVIYSSTALHCGVSQALKLASKVDKQDRENMLNERAKLQNIHAYGNVWGIQSKHREVVDISNSQEIGFFIERYKEDYLDVINGRYEVDVITKKKLNLVPLEKSLFEVHQLLFGLFFLHDQGYVHRDIKLQNILTKPDELGLIVHIADFGGVMQMTAGESFPEPTSTQFFHADDFSKIAIIFSKNAANKNELLYQVGQQQDVFAMGSVLYSIFLGKLPFTSENGYGLPIGSYKPMEEESAPLEVRNLIEKMIAVDGQTRPSAKEAYETFDQYLKNGPYNQLHTRIHQKIEREYKLQPHEPASMQKLREYTLQPVKSSTLEFISDFLEYFVFK